MYESPCIAVPDISLPIIHAAHLCLTNYNTYSPISIARRRWGNRTPTVTLASAHWASGSAVVPVERTNGSTTYPTHSGALYPFLPATDLYRDSLGHPLTDKRSRGGILRHFFLSLQLFPEPREEINLPGCGVRCDDGERSDQRAGSLRKERQPREFFSPPSVRT